MPICELIRIYKLSVTFWDQLILQICREATELEKEFPTMTKVAMPMTSLQAHEVD